MLLLGSMYHKYPDRENQAPSIHKTTISDDVLGRIYASDQDMYPAPLTYERLKSWVEACPELCICFQAPLEGGGFAPVGAIIILPLLGRRWEDVLVGKLKETDIDPASMFAEDGDADVGLHVFHIERFDACTRTGLPYFAESALETIRDIVQKKRWNILGYSGTSMHRTVFRSGANRATSTHRHRFRPRCLSADGLHAYWVRGGLRDESRSHRRLDRRHGLRLPRWRRRA